MQQRVLVKTFPTFELAHDARLTLLIENPDNEYQIRRGKDKFKLMHRFKVNELKQKEGGSDRIRNKYKHRPAPRRVL